MFLIDIIAALCSVDEEEILILMYGGRSQQETADIMGVARSTISRRIKRLVQRAA